VFLQGGDFFLDGIPADEAVSEDVAILSDAVSAIDGLCLDGGIPPGIEDEDVIGGGEVQPESARLEADEEDAAIRVGLKAVDVFFSFSGLAIEVLVDDTAIFEMLADDGEHAGELGEDEGLVSLGEEFLEMEEEDVELGAGFLFVRLVQETGMAAGLSQSEECFEDVDFRFGQTVAFDDAEKRLAVMIPEFGIELGLFFAHAAEDGLLDFFGEFVCDLDFRASEDEGPEGFREHGARFRTVEIAVRLEERGASEHAGVEEFEDGPEIPEMIFDGGSAEGESMSCAKQADRFCDLRARVFDGLCLVENDVVEIDFPQLQDIAAQGAVRREYEIDLREIVSEPGAFQAGVLHDFQLRSEGLAFFLPVEDQGFGDDDHRGSVIFGGGLSIMGEQEREQLDGFSETHIVGEAAAEFEFPEKREPSDALALIFAEFSGEAFRLAGGFDSLEVLQAIPQFAERQIEIDVGLSGEEGIENADLISGEPDVVVFRDAQVCEHAVLLEPFGGEESQGTVFQSHGGFPARERGEQFGEGDALAAEIDLCVEFEPVDVRTDLELEVTGFEDLFSFGADHPSEGNQMSDGGSQFFRGDFDVPADFVRVGGASEACGFDLSPESIFGLSVSGDVVTLLSLDQSSLGAAGADHLPAILEVHFAVQPFLLPADASWGIQDEVGGRRGGDLLELQVRGEFEFGESGHVEEAIDEFHLFSVGDGERFGSPEERDPVEGSAIPEPGDRFLGEDKPPGEDEHGIRQGEFFSVTNEIAGQLPFLLFRVFGDGQTEFPGIAGIPLEGRQFFVIGLVAEVESTGGAQLREEQLGQSRG